MKPQETPHLLLAREIAGRLNRFPMVEAIALSGSQTAETIDAASDIDLYVYGKEPVPLAERKKMVNELGASRADLNLSFWDTGDEWFDLKTGIEVDVMFWDPQWIEDQLRRVVSAHQPSMGYTTCFWHTILNSQILFDRKGWFAGFQARYQVPYPEPLRRAIISKNQSVLRTVIPSYLGQIKKALKRDDLVSVNHRVAGLFASYFDVLFALNRLTHPGEKKLVNIASQICRILPENMEEQVRAVLQAAASEAELLVPRIEALLDNLDEVLLKEGFNLKGSNNP